MLKTEYQESGDLRVISAHGEIGRFRRLAPATPVSFIVTDPNLTITELIELGQLAQRFTETKDPQDWQKRVSSIMRRSDLNVTYFAEVK